MSSPPAPRVEAAVDEEGPTGAHGARAAVCHNRHMHAATIISCTDQDMPSESEVVDLYDAVGWRAYTDAPETLMAGLRGSLRVVVARSQGRLVGLARVVGDGATICYLQDVLVHPDARRQGLGGRVVQEAFAPFTAVRQHVLITDEEAEQKAFYESLGFSQFGAAIPGRTFVRFGG